MVLSTGSPLAASQFDYVYNYISKDVCLGSITGLLVCPYFRDALTAIHGSGGTDICSLFCGMNASLPVYRGEIQCRMLGMSIHAYSDEGVRVPAGAPGNLICDQHFPCQPVGFWPLPGHGENADVQGARKRYMETYYEKVKGVWCKSFTSESRAHPNPG